MTPDDASHLFAANLSLIDRVVERVCRNAHLQPADADDFASVVKLALIENDYAVLRAWEGRSSLATYLTICVQRMLSDERSRARGRWEPSAEARRMGKEGILIETMIRRDGRSIDDVLPHVPGLGREDVERMIERLPQRTARPRPVPLEELHEAAATSVEEADAKALATELGRVTAEASAIVREALASLPLQDRVVVRLRFGEAMSIADISRMMNVPQRPLYRKVESVLDHLRRSLAAAGIDRVAAGTVIGSPLHALDFGLANGKSEETPRSNSHGDGPTRAGS